jgi:Flp pilus assembly protein CpaB
VTRRARALAFLLVALLAAGLAAAIADGYGTSVARGYGALRPVVVAVASIPAGDPIDAGRAAEALRVRRVPARFVPPGVLADPVEAIGLAPQADLPAGSYLLAAQLRAPRRRAPGRVGLGRGRHPVEILVSGAEALLAGGPIGATAKVDVVVTTEPTGSGTGRTYVAVSAVPLLAMAPAVEEPGPVGSAVATLALTRPQALRLIAAESFARRLTLLSPG